jgi:hypothetical protein
MREHRHPASTWVLLADVRISERRRQGLSAPKVELFRQWLEDGRLAPPVRLARDGDGFVVRDGRHRVAASLAAGHVGIEAVLRRLLGTKLWWRSTSLAPRTGRVRLPPSPLGVQGVLGSTARFQRARQGSTPCGRSSGDRSVFGCTPPCQGGRAGSNPAGRSYGSFVHRRGCLPVEQERRVRFPYEPPTHAGGVRGSTSP